MILSVCLFAMYISLLKGLFWQIFFPFILFGLFDFFLIVIVLPPGVSIGLDIPEIRTKDGVDEHGLVARQYRFQNNLIYLDLHLSSIT